MKALEILKENDANLTDEKAEQLLASIAETHVQLADSLAQRKRVHRFTHPEQFVQVVRTLLATRFASEDGIVENMSFTLMDYEQKVNFEHDQVIGEALKKFNVEIKLTAR